MNVKDFLTKSLQKDRRFQELEKEMRIQKMVEERMKSSDERELEGFHKIEREKMIKKNLEEFRKQQQEDAWLRPGDVARPHRRNHRPSSKERRAPGPARPGEWGAARVALRHRPRSMSWLPGLPARWRDDAADAGAQ